jgi:hypothetical protein
MPRSRVHWAWGKEKYVYDRCNSKWSSMWVIFSVFCVSSLVLFFFHYYRLVPRALGVALWGYTKKLMYTTLVLGFIILLFFLPE